MLRKATWYDNTLNWPALLPDLIHSYNNNYHMTIRVKPDAVWACLEPSQQILKCMVPNFTDGDMVRLMLKKPNNFLKGKVSKLSECRYIILGKDGFRYKLAS